MRSITQVEKTYHPDDASLVALRPAAIVQA
jgi:hypothetical protein